MNALLRIQVRLLAKEANSELQKLASAIAAVNAAQSGRGRGASSRMSSDVKDTSRELGTIQARLKQIETDKSLTAAAARAREYAASIDKINEALHKVNKVTSGKNNQWSADADQVVSLKEGRSAAAAAAREQAALDAATTRSVIANQKAATAAAKVQLKERSAAAQAATAQQKAAAKEASKAQKAIEDSRNSYLKQMWKEQTSAKRRELKEQTDAVKAAAKAQKAAETAARKVASSSGGSQLLPGDTQQNLGWFSRLSHKINGDINITRRGLVGMGKDLQWVGRQINFNFTLPLLYAGKQALDFVLKTEASFTRVQKVYSGAAEDLKPIKQGLRALSDYYGVNQAEVIKLGEAWAAAGKQGGQLLASVETSIQLATLGDYTDLTQTFEDLIVIQKAYGLSTQGLQLAIAKLNTVENATAATLPDLVTGIALVGSSARVAGISLDQLAAFMAVLTPATGSASRAANSFKTIVAQLTAPTEKVKDTLDAMGISFESQTFQMLDAGERLEFIAEKFVTLTDAQQAYVSRVLGSLWGINKFSALMQDLSSDTSEYADTLALIGKANEKANLDQAAAEIQVLLNSDPQKFQRLLTMLQNMTADVLIPLLPAIIGVLTAIRNMALWFTNLSPSTQKAAIGILVLVSAVGILAQMIGSVELLVGTFGKFLLFMVGLIPGVGAASGTAAAAVAAGATAATAAVASEATALTATVAGAATAQTAAVSTAAAAESAAVASATSAMAASSVGSMNATATASARSTALIIGKWALIAAAVVALVVVIVKNWDTIKRWVGNAIDWIGRAFAALPRIVANAFIGVVRVLQAAAKAVIHWLSYLNPFARHSPSLVDNVTAGVEVIINQYKRLNNMGNIFSRAASHLRDFAAATQAAIDAAKRQDRSEQTTDVLSIAPQAAAPLANLYADMDELEPQAKFLSEAIKQQEKVVKEAKSAYDAAAAAVDAYDKSLEPLRQHINDLKSQIDAANDIINNLANTQITGMQAYTDAIFDNEMQQKALRLEILKLAQAGKSYDDLKQKMADINGEIEMLRGKMGDLRAAGAGSDILSVYQDQIDGLEAQKSGLADSAASAQALEDQLAALQQQGEILDLEKSLQFDPLLKQIEDLVNGVKEMSFEDIIKGITEQQTNVAALTTEYDAANATLATQTTELERLQGIRDALKESYDAEQASLDALQESYQAIVDKLQEIKDAIAAVVDAKKTLTADAGGGAGAAGGAGGFEDLTGEYQDPTTYSDPKQALQSAEDWLKEFQDKVGDMFKDFNPFKWFGDAWKWVKKQIGKAFDWIVEAGETVGKWFGDLPGKIGGWIMSGLGAIGNAGLAIINWIWNGIQIAAPAIGNWFIALPGNIVGWITGAIMTVVDVGASIVDSLVKGLIEHGPDIALWFLELPIKILGWTIDAALWLVGPGKEVIGGFMVGILEKAAEVIEWFINLGSSVMDWIGDVSTTIYLKGKEILGGMMKGVIDKANEFYIWVVALPGRVVTWIGEVLDLLYTKGQNMITGLLNGVVNKVGEVTSWFGGLAGNIVSWVGDTIETLKNRGVQLVLGFFNGIIEKAQTVWDWLKELPGEIVSRIADLVTLLKEKGIQIMLGLVNGIIEKALDVWNYLKELPGKIIGNIPNPLEILKDVGKKIMQGLWDGMKDIWGNITGWLSNLNPANWFNDINVEKGHADVNMLPAGYKTVMGLQKGMKAGWDDTQRWLKSLNPTEVLTMNVDTAFRAGRDALTPTLDTRAIQPVGQTVDNSKTINVTIADVSFPGITSSDDAEQFLLNLESLGD